MTGYRRLFLLSPSIWLWMVPVLNSGCTSPVVSPTALSLARQRVAHEVGTPPKKGTLIIVDYTKPSSEKRMTVVDLGSGRSRMNSLVAHGVNSGLLYATDFSDQVGSEKSSLGLYEVSEGFNGKHGNSLRLDGLDPGLNLNARKRGIIVHSADYVSQETMRENRNEYGRLGRSAGCLALSDRDMAKLDRKLVRPAYVFAYAPTLVANYDLPAVPRTLEQQTVADTAPLLASTAPSTPAPARPAAEPIMDRPAIPRPTLIETTPVSLAQYPNSTGFYYISGIDSRP